jgi:DNA-binding NarL/FixJ family response regulator
MRVVLLSNDLMVVSRVQGAAVRVGAAVRALSNASQAIESCGAEQADVLIVDLATPSLDLVTLVNQLKANATLSTRVVAFGPHVHEDRLEAAREAGCDVVMSRGKFFAEIDAMLRG